jgi:heat shock protein HslJ
LKKKLLFLIIVLFSIQGFSQDNTIFQTWYLYAYNPYPDHVYITEIVPYINPTLIISENLDFSGEAACNSFNGSFTYDSDTDSLIVNPVSSTDNDCGVQEHTDFESYFFDVFSEGTIWQYELGFENKFLTFEDTEGNVLWYQNFPIQNPDFSQTWYLNNIYYEFDPEVIVSEINPPISPTFIVDGVNFSGQAACNTYTGTFSLFSNSEYQVETFSKTNNACEDQSHIDFESNYFGNFGIGYSYYPLIVDGNFDIQYLNLQNPLFQGMLFSNVAFPVPSLLDTWYLSSIEYDSGDIIDIASINPAIAPDLKIYPSLEMEGIGDCNGFGGSFEYDATNETLTTLNFYATLLICDEESIENEYINFFADEMPISYSLRNDFEWNKELVLEHPTLDYLLIFNEIPLLSSPDFTISDITVYPNPVSDRLYISSENSVIEKIIVYSINGKILIEKIVETNSIDVSGLSKGIYFIGLISSEGKSIQKFIKK